MAKQQFQWERDAEDEDEDLPAVGEREGRGGAQRKREADALDELARTLVEMAAHEWEQLPMNAGTIEQLVVAQRLMAAKRHKGAFRHSCGRWPGRCAGTSTRRSPRRWRARSARRRRRRA